jgi:hypothetical protein
VKLRKEEEEEEMLFNGQPIMILYQHHGAEFVR